MSFLMKKLCNSLHSIGKPWCSLVRSYKYYISRKSPCISIYAFVVGFFFPNHHIILAVLIFFLFSIFLCRCAWCRKKSYKKFAADQIPWEVFLPSTSYVEAYFHCSWSASVWSVLKVSFMLGELKQYNWTSGFCKPRISPHLLRCNTVVDLMLAIGMKRWCWIDVECQKIWNNLAFAVNVKSASLVMCWTERGPNSHQLTSPLTFTNPLLNLYTTETVNTSLISPVFLKSVLRDP